MGSIMRSKPSWPFTIPKARDKSPFAYFVLTPNSDVCPLLLLTMQATDHVYMFRPAWSFGVIHTDWPCWEKHIHVTNRLKFTLLQGATAATCVQLTPNAAVFTSPLNQIYVTDMCMRHPDRSMRFRIPCQNPLPNPTKRCNYKRGQTWVESRVYGRKPLMWPTGWITWNGRYCVQFLYMHTGCWPEHMLYANIVFLCQEPVD